MHCPFCHNPDSRVVDTRIADDGASIRRRRECTHCKKRFTTLETSSFQVVKRSGVVESFSRNKVVSGVKKACLRFASVYRAFDTLEDFEDAIQALRERSQAPAAPDEVGEEPLSAPTPPKKTRKTRASRKRAAGPTLLGDE